MIPLAQQPADYLTEANYLEGEKRAEVRHEYINGQVIAMAGSSLRHNDIALNLAFALRSAARGTLCRVNVSEVKVHIEQVQSYYYPDVVVSCQTEDIAAHSIKNPCLIVEVTSQSTQWRDFTEKAVAYQKLESLKAYLVVAQDVVQVTLYFRDTAGGWQVARFDTLDQELSLPCPPGTLFKVSDIYAGVES